MPATVQPPKHNTTLNISSYKQEKIISPFFKGLMIFSY